MLSLPAGITVALLGVMVASSPAVSRLLSVLLLGSWNRVDTILLR